MKHLTLNQLNKGRKAVVVELNGGYGLTNRLNGLGIMKKKEVIKISNSFMKGPVTVKIGQSKIAIGHGMAEKIFVKMVDNR